MCVVEIGLLEVNIKMQTGDIPEVNNFVHCLLQVLVIYLFYTVTQYARGVHGIQ